MRRRGILALAAAVLVPIMLTAGCGKDDPKGPTDPEIPSGWEKRFPVGAAAAGNSVKQTSDGGYIMTGWTQGQATNFLSSVLLLKTDASGNKMWHKVFGAPRDASGVSVLQTPDGGYFVLADYHGQSDEFWLIKTDSAGNMAWNQFKGYGDRDESAEEARMTSDGGYVLIGTTYFDGRYDVWLLKTGPNGENHWNRTKGYSDSSEFGQSVQQAADGGYVLVGYTTRAAGPHIWLVKTYANGDTHWHQTINISEPAMGCAICKTSDGAYVVMGEIGQGDQRNIHLFKYNEAGNELWRGAHAAAGCYFGGDVQQTSDGGFMVATTRRPAMSSGGDFCLIKFDGAGNALWSKTYGAGTCESGGQTADGGYILCGGNAASTAIYLVKTDPDGNT